MEMPVKINTPPKGKINLRLIAQKAGLGASTVSRVLRGMTNVSPEAREKVFKLVHHVGYDAKKRLRSARAARNKKVFINLPLGTLEQPTSSFYHQLFLLLRNELTTEGFEVVNGGLGNTGVPGMKTLEDFGLVISLRPTDRHWLPRALKKFPGLRALTLTYQLDGALSALPDDVRGAEALADYCLTQKHFRMDILADIGNPAYLHRMDIFSGCLLRGAPKSRIERRTCVDVFEQEDFVNLLNSWYPEPRSLPEAFFCPSGWHARFLYNHLKNLGAGAVEIVCFDRPFDRNGKTLPICYVDFDLRALAKAGVYLATQVPKPQRFQPSQILIETKIHFPHPSKR